MQYLILAAVLLISGEVNSNPLLSCRSVQEIASTILDAPGLTTEQKNQIIGRLYGRHLAGCGEFVEDANVDEGTG